MIIPDSAVNLSPLLCLHVRPQAGSAPSHPGAARDQIQVGPAAGWHDRSPRGIAAQPGPVPASACDLELPWWFCSRPEAWSRPSSKSLRLLPRPWAVASEQLLPQQVSRKGDGRVVWLIAFDYTWQNGLASVRSGRTLKCLVWKCCGRQILIVKKTWVLWYIVMVYAVSLGIFGITAEIGLINH